MKRLLTLALLACAGNVTAQCPNTSITQEGVHPSALGTACLNAPYSQEVTLVYPVDTTLNVPPFGTFTIPFDSVRVDMVNDLPTGLSYACNDPACSALPTGFGEPPRECVTISGTPTEISTVDSIEFIITAYATVLGGVQSFQYSFKKALLPTSEVTIDNVVANGPLCAGQFNGTLEVQASTTGGAITGYSIDNGLSFQSTSVFSQLNDGTYQLVVENDLGCVDTTTVELADPDPLSIDAFNQQNPTCAGDADGSLDLEVSGGDGGPYQYSIDGGATFQNTGEFTGLSAGVITVQVKDGNNCLLNTGINLFDGWQPDTSVTVGPNSLSVTFLNGVQWYDCDNMMPVSGETGPVFEPTVSGNYALIRTLTGFGCVDTSACYFVEALPVAVQENELMQVQPLPNPTNGQVDMALGRTYSTITCRVKNLAGQLIYEAIYHDVTQLTLRLDAEPGMYLLELSDPQGHAFTHRLLKE